MSSGSNPDERHLLGIDFGTESCRAAIFDLHGRRVAVEATPYKLSHPRPGWAEQDPDEWWSALVESVGKVMRAAELDGDAIAGLSADATTCTVIALDDAGRPLRPAIMWMDVRAADQARRIGESEHPARRYNGGGPVSAEWLPSKLLWLKESEPDTYSAARYLVDAPDWITFRLTGRMTANVNTAAVRGYHDRDHDGWPVGFYEEIGLDDAFAKLPEDVLDLGAPVEGLSEEAAQELGLTPGTPVAQGGGDAWVGQIGLGVVQPGRMALITGSSHVLSGQSEDPISGRGFFGAFTDAVIPGQYTLEGGQVSTGSVLKWFKDNFCSDRVREEAERRQISDYEVLNERIRKIPPGSDGLIVNEYWQGNRTPYTDPLARGIIWGLSLHHTPEHVYRAIQEGICYGTAQILRAMGEAGFEVRELVAAGGFTNSPELIQMHADVSGLPIRLTEVGDAVVLGGAILAAVGADLFDSVGDAAETMVHESRTIEPDPDAHQTYAPFVEAYADTYPAMRPVMHELASHLPREGEA
ncbi:MAG: FGGY-family carbohydrate kinase [Solirubrobacteraceae bacterium]